MKCFKLILLAVVLLVTPGFKIRCWILCTDQTSIQSDYVAQRDHCREYATTKLDLAMSTHPEGADTSGKKSMMVKLFNECMANNGWNVSSSQSSDTSGGGGAAPQAAAASKSAPVQAVPVPQNIAPTAEERAALSRSAECNFARYAASTSSISAARAKACDLECAQRLKASPDAPRPAACPSSSSPDLSTGRDRE